MREHASPQGTPPVSAYPFASFIGPRQVGGIYFSAYWGKTYEVLAIGTQIYFHDGTALPSDWWISVRWENGAVSNHSTPWEDGKDRVISHPASELPECPKGWESV